MLSVRLYTRPGCHLCEAVEARLAELQADHPHRLATVNIDDDAALKRRYGTVIPVVVVEGRWVLVTRIDLAMLRDALARATDH